MVKQAQPPRELCFVVRIGEARRTPVFDFEEYFVDLEVLAPQPQPAVYVFASTSTLRFEQTRFAEVVTRHVIRLSSDDLHQFARTGTVHLAAADLRFGDALEPHVVAADACEPGTALHFAAPDPAAPDPPQERLGL
jgi:hypothetical protein